MLAAILASGLAVGAVFQQAANVTAGGVFASVAVFIIVLLAAPSGLFGARQARRV